MKNNLKVIPKLYVVAIMLLLIVTSKAEATVQKVYHITFFDQVDQLLKDHVRGGQVRYTFLQQRKKELASITQQIATYDLSKASANEKKAFYINAYNMLVWQQVIHYYPVKSVMDIAGFFDAKKYNVAGEMLTLNELEKKKLIAPYKDARIHFALVCAAKSCPPLLAKAFRPATLDAQLEAQTKQTLQDKNFIRVDAKTNKVQVSEIFRWYEADFLREAPSIVDYINKYLPKPLPAKTVGYYTYDWALNDTSLQ
ncbi:DUF547 domain-containing protein [Pontibacter arcticus]|uniref:DUF547 domain-containing protein n=1 Tax=Pontibacter arcticus TaxID=2080288 RepID=A0A364RBR1_9BACT|nr:DUF547 domain-containing protein [Pontibacter arcticus]RAU81768.1 DUF547 domain-containing protein [Pontibacter arcticus]